MSFDFFFKACNFWSKNLPTCDTCTGRMTSHSNLESISRQSEIQDPNISIDSENIPYQSKITPPTGVPTNYYSSASSRQEESENLSINSKNYKFSGNQRGRVWSQEEDNFLIKSVKMHDGKNWKSIAKLVPGRSATQCSQRWRRIQPYKARQPWSKDEDKLILSLVDKHGCNWSLISSMIEGRTGKQVRERYLNKLDKNINRSKFSEEDDELIIELYEKFGPKWKEISKNFKGRPENMIKNRFYSHIRKRLLLNPEKYQSLLNNINNDNEMLASMNSSTFNQEDPKIYLDIKKEEYDINNAGKLLNFNFSKENGDFLESNNIKQENNDSNHNMVIENCFDLNYENNILHQNYDLAPLTPNKYGNEKEIESFNVSNNLFLNENQDFPNNFEIEQEEEGEGKFEEIEFFNIEGNNPKDFSRKSSNEDRKAVHLRHLEFLNKKQELLEQMRNEVKEQIKLSQQTQISNS